jgi:hypothetical protein
MASREMGHPFVVEYKRLAYEAVKRKTCEMCLCYAVKAQGLISW